MYALYSRLMQFCSGPGKHTFFACDEHKKYLTEGVMNFIIIDDEKIKSVDINDELDCDWCREE